MGRPRKTDTGPDEPANGEQQEAVEEPKVSDTRLIAENKQLREEIARLQILVRANNQKPVEAYTGQLPEVEPIPTSEIGNPGGIETISEVRFEEEAEAEAFANEILTIVVADTTEEGALKIITPNVNSVNQPIIRGKRCKVKRKYVECLARARTTKYTQEVPDPRYPDRTQMVDATALSYPFTVEHDPNPKGRAWLMGILQQQ